MRADVSPHSGDIGSYSLTSSGVLDYDGGTSGSRARLAAG